MAVDHPARTAPVPAAARRRRLRVAIAERGFVSVAAVARELGTSQMTVRRDLEALRREGVIERSHGGAVPALPESVAAVKTAELDARTEAKQAIARAAASLLTGRAVIGLDVGTTVAALAGLLAGRAGLSVVTNSLRAVAALSPAEAGAPMPDVYVLGGQFRPGQSCLAGSVAQRQLADHWLNTVFIGAAGLSEEGLFDHEVEETHLTMAYIRAAEEVVVLCDASKFGRRGLARVCGLEAVHRLITDAEPPPSLRAALDRAGVRVTIAA